MFQSFYGNFGEAFGMDKTETADTEGELQPEIEKHDAGIIFAVEQPLRVGEVIPYEKTLWTYYVTRTEQWKLWEHCPMNLQELWL